MIPRHSAMFVTIGAAAVLALGVTTPAAAQLPSDTATVQRSDTTPAVSQQRIPVTKEQGTLDTTSSAGALSRPQDTTGAVAPDTTTASITTGVPTDTTRREGITGINDTTVNADTAMIPADTSIARSDTS